VAAIPIERLNERLWPAGVDGGAYAILDGARAPAVYEIVQSGALAAECLYVGKLAPVLARAAPYLVRLERASAPTARLLSRAWGESWGVFLRTGAPMRALHRHLRRFLRVQDERGRRLLFRYYDPRVLRAYLPTCTPEELAYVLGPIDAFVLEGETAESVLEFRVGDGALDRRETRVERRLEWIKDYLRRG